MTTRIHSARTLGLIGTALAAAAFAFALSPASPALAHDQLVGTTPTDNAVLDTAPEELVLSFNNSLLEVGTVINVTAPDGTSATEGEPRLSGRDALQTLRNDLPHGGYSVVWRVVSSDGHPISGAFDFTVGTASTAETPSTAEPTDTHVDEHDHADAAEDHDSDVSSSGTTEASIWTSPLLWSGIAGSLALVTVVIVLTVRSAQRRARDTDSAE